MWLSMKKKITPAVQWNEEIYNISYMCEGWGHRMYRQNVHNIFSIHTKHNIQTL